MGADRRDPQVRLISERGELAPQLDDVLTRVRDRRTNLRAEFDDRLVHLRLDLFFQQDLAALENFLDVGAQLTRLRVYNRELFLDPEGEGMVRSRHYLENIVRGFRRFTEIISKLGTHVSP